MLEIDALVSSGLLFITGSIFSFTASSFLIGISSDFSSTGALGTSTVGISCTISPLLSLDLIGSDIDSTGASSTRASSTGASLIGAS